MTKAGKMAKYINSDLNTRFSKLLKVELPKKTTLETLWNQVYDNLLTEAEITIQKDIAQIRFWVGEIEHKCSRKRNEVLIETDSGDIKDEKYEVLILDALKYMLDNRVFAKKNMKKKKEKG